MKKIQDMELLELIQLFNYIKESRHHCPYLYEELVTTIQDILSKTEMEIKDKQDNIERLLREQRLEKYIRHYEEKYPDKYRFYKGSVYVVMQKQDDGMTIREWILGSPNGLDLCNKLSEAYDYEDYVEREGRIYYGSRYMTKGKIAYLEWKKVFDNQ